MRRKCVNILGHPSMAHSAPHRAILGEALGISALLMGRAEVLGHWLFAVRLAEYP